LIDGFARQFIEHNLQGDEVGVYVDD